jgi:hypothetical protein
LTARAQYWLTADSALQMIVAASAELVYRIDSA